MSVVASPPLSGTATSVTVLAVETATIAVGPVGFQPVASGWISVVSSGASVAAGDARRGEVVAGGVGAAAAVGVGLAAGLDGGGGAATHADAAYRMRDTDLTRRLILMDP
jgi:hypothetical protein